VSTEGQWWDALVGEEVERNAYGWPHYDAEEVASFIESHVSGPRVLDLGCGPGRLGHLLARRNITWDLYGVDVSPNMVARSITDAPPNWDAYVNDGQQLPNIRIDDAYSVTVLQHVDETTARSYVAQVHDMLSIGGVFLFTYAVGDEDTFLSHQIEHDTALDFLNSAGFSRSERLVTPDTHPAWNWAIGYK
jgi:SAM-dependent methyltransferase